MSGEAGKPLRAAIKALELERAILLEELEAAEKVLDRAERSAQRANDRRYHAHRAHTDLLERRDGIDQALVELRASLPRDWIDYEPRPT